MAIFQPAFEKTLRFEGGYVNDPADAGGETYCGISRPNWPNNGIWPVIKACNPPLKRGGFVVGANAEKAKQIVADFYRIQFWDDIKADHIASQSVAEYLYDWHVTSGGIAVRQVQDILDVDTDGRVGTQTLAAINKAKPQNLFNQMVAVRVQRAHDRVAAKPNQKKFLKGWLNRFQGFQFVS